MNGDSFNRAGDGETRGESGALSAPDAAPWRKRGTGIMPVMTARHRQDAGATPDFSALNISGLF